jgi:hypothetical protein
MMGEGQAVKLARLNGMLRAGQLVSDLGFTYRLRHRLSGA